MTESIELTIQSMQAYGPQHDHWVSEKLDVMRDPLTVVSVRREPLRAMTDDLDYGFLECELEGFGAHPDYKWPSSFVAMFCTSHRGCTPETTVTRIEFSYGEEQ